MSSHVVLSGEVALREAEAALAAERERAARLVALLTARQQAADERLAALDRKVACLLGGADALRACTATELETLEQVCAAWGSVCRMRAP
jgi:2-methylisocitrate lyase-like PEP mutase family enzyme